MKYLIINELYIKGGTEVQSLREKENFEAHGDEVFYITFDPEYVSENDEIKNHINIDMHYSGYEKRIYRFFENRKLTRKLKKIINEFDPDLIHINNTTDHALSVFKAVKGYPVFQTIRDYAAVCPTGFCVDKNWNICEGRKCGKCLKKCLPHKRKVMFLYYYIISKKNLKYRKKYIGKFVCPSETLSRYCNSHGLDTICINNPFDFIMLDGIEDTESIKKIYFYYGFVAEHKGVTQLLDAFSIFAQGKDVELWIVGEQQPQMQDYIKKYCENKKIKYFGKQPYAETLKILSQVYVVVVPSLWLENYPNTVLEGLCAGKIVIASNRGGMSEMIRNDNFIFDVMNQKDIISKLNYSFYLSETEYKNITEKNKLYVQENNSLDKYYDRVMNLYQTLKSDELFRNDEGK